MTYCDKFLEKEVRLSEIDHYWDCYGMVYFVEYWEPGGYWCTFKISGRKRGPYRMNSKHMLPVRTREEAVRNLEGYAYMRHLRFHRGITRG